MRTLYFRLLRWLHRFEEFPNYNRWLAGLYQLLWVRECGHDWAYAWRCACIYWRTVPRA
jgi:hypothetical protein